MTDKTKLNKEELSLLNTQVMEKFICFMYQYFNEKLLKTEGLGRIASDKNEVLQTIRDSVLTDNFESIKDDPHLVINVFKDLINRQEIGDRTIFLSTSSNFSTEAMKYCKEIHDQKTSEFNINELQSKLDNLLYTLSKENYKIYNCMIMIFKLCNNIADYSYFNMMTKKNVIIAMQSVLVIFGLKQKFLEDTLETATLSLQNLPLENVIFEVLINFFRKKEPNMSDVVTENENDIDDVLLDETLTKSINNLEDSIAKANILAAGLINGLDTPSKIVDAIDNEFQNIGNPKISDEFLLIENRIKTIDSIPDNFATAQINKDLPFECPALDEKKSEILDAYYEYILSIRENMQIKWSQDMQTSLEEINITKDVIELSALEKLKENIEKTSENLKAFLPDEFLDKLNNRIIPLSISLELQSRLYNIYKSHDNAELEALRKLKDDINIAPNNVTLILPGGNTEQLLTKVDFRLNPLVSALVLQGRFAKINPTHDNAELEALEKLKDDINTAPDNVKLILPGGNTEQLLSSINIKIAPLTIALGIQNSLAQILATHDQLELNSLTTLKLDINRAAKNVKDLLPGGSAAQLIENIDKRINPLSIALQLQNKFNTIIPTRNEAEKNALEKLRKEIEAVSLDVKNLLPGGNAAQLIENINKRINPLEKALLLQKRLLDIAATKNKIELDALNKLLLETERTSQEIKNLLPGNFLQTIQTRINKAKEQPKPQRRFGRLYDRNYL